MNYRYLLLSSLFVIGLCGALKSPAHAQPDPNEAPKGTNPPNWNMGPGPALPLTAEQLRERRAEVKAQNIKRRLMGAGFTDEALQTAVVNEFKAQDTAQTDLGDKWQKINLALRPNQTPPADLAAMLKDFRDAVAKEKARRATALAALEAQFQVSQKPVLDALLMTMGITGDEAEFVNQIMGNGLNPMFTLPLIRGGMVIPENMNPRVFALPDMGGMADGGPTGNQHFPLIPLPQKDAAKADGMPNAAHGQDAGTTVFF